MNLWDGLAKWLLMTGAVLCFFGLFIKFLGSVLGRWPLPGDIVIEKGNSVFIFPLATCVILSIVLTVILNILRGR